MDNPSAAALPVREAPATHPDSRRLDALIAMGATVVQDASGFYVKWDEGFTRRTTDDFPDPRQAVDAMSGDLRGLASAPPQPAPAPGATEIETLLDEYARHSIWSASSCTDEGGNEASATAAIHVRAAILAAFASRSAPCSELPPSQYEHLAHGAASIGNFTSEHEADHPALAENLRGKLAELLAAARSAPVETPPPSNANAIGLCANGLHVFVGNFATHCDCGAKTLAESRSASPEPTPANDEAK